MDEWTLAKESLQLAGKDLALPDGYELESSEDPLGSLQEFLAKQIRYMLDNDLNGLLNALYRVDIPEKRVKQILEVTAPGEIADQLAGAVIEREKQKVITRQQYKTAD